jgi:hypothetical protein
MISFTTDKPGWIDGNASSSQFNHPVSLALESVDGPSVLIADGYNNRIRRINLDTMVVDTVAGSKLDGSQSPHNVNPCECVFFIRLCVRMNAA